MTNYYKLVLTNLNLAGDSDPVEKNINFSDCELIDLCHTCILIFHLVLRYHVHINQTSYFNDILQVIVTVAVSTPTSLPMNCPLSLRLTTLVQYRSHVL